ncbi:multiple myeloma tumor-associated protein 2 homolog [Vitis riparia]|uniref:multiple myeloma tumor-associated protein 2 homolog n=1 Tax=Vitis riparia TaxID=96939 RepID=UPI00155AF81A|nr:multiple myeloma tumor-associated protein 2 homolog [Vitis riparia]
MYHPTRGGVRGGRDQFKWDDVKVDKHRENYLGHSIKAPVGRWQKGKDLHWYSRDKKSESSDMEAAKEEIKRIKEQEEQAMREALGLAPKRANRPQGNRLDKHEFSELVKRGSTAEDLGAGHSEAAHVQGLGFARAPRNGEEFSSLQPSPRAALPEKVDVAVPNPTTPNTKEELEDESYRKKRRREEKKHEKHEKHERREKRHSRDDDDRRKRKKDKRRHDSD